MTHSIQLNNMNIINELDIDDNTNDDKILCVSSCDICFEENINIIKKNLLMIN